MIKYSGQNGITPKKLIKLCILSTQWQCTIISLLQIQQKHYNLLLFYFFLICIKMAHKDICTPYLYLITCTLIYYYCTIDIIFYNYKYYVYTLIMFYIQFYVV